MRFFHYSAKAAYVYFWITTTVSPRINSVRSMATSSTPPSSSAPPSTIGRNASGAPPPPPQQQQQQQQLTSPKTVNLFDLASAAVACSVTASRSIRKIARPEENAKNTRLKEDGSFVTDADFAAQGVIVEAIRTIHESLKIVGEESPEEMAQHVKKDQPCLDSNVLERARREIRLRFHRHKVLHNLPLAKSNEQETLEAEEETTDHNPASGEDDHLEDDPQDCFVDASRVCVIVDPLDGTKSYTRGDYDSVSILIGIILDNRPIFGVVGKPFGYSGITPILDTTCAAIYGGTLIKGAFVAGGEELRRPEILETSDLPKAVISESRSKGIVHDFCVHLGEKGLIDPCPMRVAGAGEKSLRILLSKNREALWFFPKPGTYLWDVAAPDALLRTLGGKMTDKNGNEMDYSKSREEAENIDGVVACSDPELHEKTIQLYQEGSWENQQ